MKIVRNRVRPINLTGIRTAILHYSTANLFFQKMKNVSLFSFWRKFTKQDLFWFLCTKNLSKIMQSSFLVNTYLRYNTDIKKYVYSCHIWNHENLCKAVIFPFPLPHCGFLAILASSSCSEGKTLCMEIVRNRVQPRNLAGIRTALLRNSTASLLGTPTCSAIIPVRKTSSKWRNGCSV